MDIQFSKNKGEQLLVEAGIYEGTVLVLGVTPELCSLDLPNVRRVIAVDQSVEMINSIWPGPTGEDDFALQANWSDIPLDDGCVDLVLSDGSLTPLNYPEAHEAVFTELHRLLRPGGSIIMRCFLQGRVRETAASLLADLREGHIRSFHALKWRIAMALQPSAEEGIDLHSVWKMLTGELPDPVVAAQTFSWRVDEVRTIESYRGSTTRYSFPTLEEQCEVAERAGFTLIETFTPGYELGDHCSTLVFKRGQR